MKGNSGKKRKIEKKKKKHQKRRSPNFARNLNGV